MSKYIQSTLIPAIRRWLSPPVFDGDAVKTRQAGLLNVFVIVSFAFLLLVMPGIMLGNNVPHRTLILAVIWFFVILRFRHLLHLGKIRAVTIFLTVPFFLVVTALNFSLGTIRTPTAGVYVFWVVMIGLLFGWRGIVMSTVASSLAILGLIVAENAGLMP